MDQNHIAFKFLRRFDGVFLALLLLVMTLAVALTPGHAQGPEEVVLYQENFNDGKPVGWNLESEKVDEFEFGWAVTKGMLRGTGHYWARYTDGRWGDGPLTFRFKLIELVGGVHANVHVSDTGRYAIGFRYTKGQEELSLYLFKQFWPDTFFNDLATNTIPYTPTREYLVDIVTEEGNIQVFVYKAGQESGAMLAAINYTDTDPLPPGTIAFETLDGAIAVVDDVAVIGTPQEPTSWTLQGRVYKGEGGDENHPVKGVTVSVYGANNPYPDHGILIASTTTDEHGWYGIEVSDRYEFYSIRENDPPGYASVGATSVDGTVRTSNWIEYIIPLEEQTRTGNKFWDRLETEPPSAPEGPDLAILSADNWRLEEDGQVLVLLVKIANQGDTRANQTRVYAWDPQHDWSGRESMVPAFNPEETETIEIRLDIPEEQRGTTHVFTLEVDPEDEVREIDEGNNVERTPGIFIPSLEVSPTPTEAPTTPLETEFDYPDLVILNAEFGEFSDDMGVLVLSVRVANRGNAGSPKTQVHARDPESGLLSKYSSVPVLLPGEDEWVGIELAIPEEQRGITHTFRVEVDPEEMVTELNEGNNVEWTRGIVIPPLEVPPPPTEPPQEPDPVPLILIVVAIATLGGITLTIRHYTITQHHKKWQVEAKEEEPPEHCQYCTHHCRKIELVLDQAMRKIAYLSLGAYDPVHGELIKDGQVTGEIVDGLNKVVSARHRRADAETLQELVTPQAQALLQQIMGLLREELAPHDVSIAGHLEGGKVTCQFILYHCKRRGNVNIWEEEAKWEATIKDERDEPVGILHSIDPAELGISERLTPALTRLLMQFIEKV